MKSKIFILCFCFLFIGCSGTLDTISKNLYNAYKTDTLLLIDVFIFLFFVLCFAILIIFFNTIFENSKKGFQLEIKNLKKRLFDKELQLKKTKEERNYWLEIFENYPIPSAIIDQKGNVRFINKSLTNILGYTKNDVPNWNYWLAPIGSGVKRNKYKLFCKNASSIDIDFHSELLGDEFIASFYDITECVKLVTKLKKDEILLNEIINRIPHGIIIITEKKHKIRFINIAAYNIFNDSESLYIGESISEYFNNLEIISQKKDQKNISTIIEDVFETKRSSFDNTLQFKRSDKKKIWINIDILAMLDREEQLFEVVLIVSDITLYKEENKEDKRLTPKFFRNRKIDAIGDIASGVAHDLNNILSGLVSYPDLILMEDNISDEVKSAVKIIQESGLKATSVVEDLTTVIKGVAVVTEIVSLNDMIKEYLNSKDYRNLRCNSPLVSVNISLDPRTFYVKVSKSHLRKGIDHLVTNATEAFQGNSGNIAIKTFNAYLESLEGYEEVEPGHYAVMQISDDAGTLGEENIARIFEPFYCKKVLGRNCTGLGLTMVWNMVHDQNGYIHVCNKDNQTVFNLYFKITEDNTPRNQRKAFDFYKGNGENILIVDDEKRQRVIACNMLKALKYNPKAVSSGEDAIEYIKDHTVDLIILDMIMPPGIDGCETYKRILEVSPDQKAIIASAFSENEKIKKTQDLGAGEYIKKPYTMKILAKAVEKELRRVKKDL